MAHPVRAVLGGTVEIVKSTTGDLAFQTTVFLPELSESEWNHLLRCLNKNTGSILVSFHEGIPDEVTEEVLKDD